MIIVPVVAGGSRKKIPYACLALILVNTLTYACAYLPVTALHAGLLPFVPEWVGLIEGIFVHQSFFCLAGNMILLSLAGGMLEAAIGPWSLTTLYVACGIGASLFFGILLPTAPEPFGGAAGAIAGVMGGCTVIIGARRVKVCWLVGNPSNDWQFTPVVLLPVWIAFGVLMVYTGQDVQAVTLVSLGGLFSGLAIGGLCRLLQRERIETLFPDAGIRRRVETLLNSGFKDLMEFDLQSARNDFVGVLELDPDNLQALRQLYAIDKSQPGSDELHESAGRLLNRLQAGSNDEYLEVFEDYKGLAKVPRLSGEMLEKIGALYLARKRYMKAAPLLATVLKRAPENERLPGLLLQLAEGFRRRGQQKEAARYFTVLVERYPESRESREAARRLERDQR